MQANPLSTAKMWQIFGKHDCTLTIRITAMRLEGRMTPANYDDDKADILDLPDREINPTLGLYVFPSVCQREVL